MALEVFHYVFEIHFDLLDILAPDELQLRLDRCDVIQLGYLLCLFHCVLSGRKRLKRRLFYGRLLVTQRYVHFGQFLLYGFTRPAHELGDLCRTFPFRGQLPQLRLLLHGPLEHTQVAPDLRQILSVFYQQLPDVLDLADVQVCQDLELCLFI